MKRQEFVDAVRDSLQLAELAPDEAGVVSIEFDGDLEIEIFPRSESRLLLRSKIAPLPDDHAEHEGFLRDYLQRNLSCLHTQQGSLTLDAETNSLWFYRIVELEPLDSRIVVETLGDFVNQAEWWRQTQSSAPSMGAMPFTMLRP